MLNKDKLSGGPKKSALRVCKNSNYVIERNALIWADVLSRTVSLLVDTVL